jgi:photosystem II stability/assembly factor-like uncharacterized protein
MAGLRTVSANAFGMKRLVVLLALALLAPASAHADPVGVGHSGWYWGNPQPQGETLRAVELNGSFGLAAGDFGALLRTQDGGRSWSAVRSGNRYSNEWDIAIAGSSAIFGGGCFTGRSDDAGVTFKKLPSRCLGVKSVSLPSPLRAYRLLGGGEVQRADDGITFADVAPVPGTGAAGAPSASLDYASDIFFTDNNTGFAVTLGGSIYRTTDGGHTWFLRTKAPEALNAVYFFDAGTGYAVGRGSTVMKTTDGGETWNPKPVPDSIPKGELTSISCGTSANCMITTGILSPHRLLHTTNGGNTWTALTPTTEHLYDVAYSSNSDAVAVGDYGITVITTNANSDTPTFVRVGDDPLPGHFSRVRAGSADLVLAPGQTGRLARSTDGGRHWRAIQLPTSANLRDAWFVDADVGFALDAGGRVFRTTNGGDNWAEFGTPSGVEAHTLYAPDQNTVLLFGPTGVRRGTGGSFDLVGDDVIKGAPTIEYDSTGGGAIFAYGDTALFVSRDAGATWKRVPGPYRNARYRKVDFVTRNVGFAVPTTGRLYRTGNGGRSWREVLSTGSKSHTDVSFSDANNGFLGNGRAGVLRTTDGGTTWHPQLLSEFRLDWPSGLVSPDPNTAFALSNAQGFSRLPSTRLFFTNTGGDLATTPSTLTLEPSRTVVTQRRRVKVTGRLTPGAAGASVRVYVRDNTTHQWRFTFPGPKVDAAGRFSVSPWIDHTSQLVAQWAGNEKVRGAGSRYVTIRMR